MIDVVVIGGGLTGLTTTYLLRKENADVMLLEKESHIGGAIRTDHIKGYTLESGPNTGSVSNPEVTELFEMLGLDIEEASPKAEKRLILKNKKWHPLPNGPVSFFRTPLFTTSDKIRIAFEPLRPKGKNPEESVASLASRRIGKSFVDYAVNPFIGGIYAGDPSLLTAKYALPKLYNMEQKYGSFIGGAIKKSREPKSERDKKATKKVFSVYGGLSTLIEALSNNIEKENIVCNVNSLKVEYILPKLFEITYTENGINRKIQARNVVSTIGAHALPQVFPFINAEDMQNIATIKYAKVIEISVALKKGALGKEYRSFGGLIPEKENRQILGVLIPSACFRNRAPQGCDTLAIYMGGIRNTYLFELTDEEINEIVKKELKELFNISPIEILFTKIYRHPFAIPQYEKTSGKRFESVKKIEEENPGLIIAGNLRDGIGMADRIKQSFNIVNYILK